MSGGKAAAIVCSFLLTINPVFAKKPNPSNNPPGLAQQGGGTFSLPVLVLGHDGKPLADLNQNELKLYQGKEELEIESVTRTPGGPARIGLLIDKTPSSAPSLRKLDWHGDAHPLGNLIRAGDFAFVATFSKSPALLCALTSDLDEVTASLHRAISEPPSPGGSAINDAMLWAFHKGEPGLKSLIILSDMSDNSSEHTRNEVITSAQLLGILIYPVIPYRDLESNTRFGKEDDAMGRDTGGVTYIADSLDELQRALDSIRADLDNTYTVSYHSNSTGHFKIKIRCSRKGAKIIAPDRRF